MPKIFSYLTKKFSYWVARHKRIRIGISINNANNSELVAFCNKEIYELNLVSKITFEYYDSNDNHSKKFEKMVLSPRLDVVVWTHQENKNSKIPLNFTFKDTTNHLVKKIIDSEMNSLVSKEKLFNIKRETFNLDLQLEKENVANLSLYIVAICTSLFRGIDNGIYVFEKLDQKTKNQRGIFRENIIRRLKDLYSIKGRDLVYRKKYKAGIEILEKGHAIDENDPDILASMAFANFLIGKEELAEKLSSQLLQNHTDFPIAHLDIAFFRIRRGRYSQALKSYKCYRRLNNDNYSSLEVITFLSDILDKHPQELGYLFGRAFLKRLISDKPELIGESTYIQDFNSFISRAGQDPKYRVLIEEAYKILKNNTTL